MPSGSARAVRASTITCRTTAPPTSYLWINTTPLPLVREELRKAYDAGASRLWVINVGDLKPSEIALEFTLRLAWHIDDWTESNVGEYVAALAQRDFGAANKQEIADIVMRYYQVNIARRPEFMTKTVYMSPRPEEVDGYVEANGYVALEAEHFNGHVNRGGAEWRVLSLLGRSGDAVKVFPDVAASVMADYATAAAELSYKIHFFTTGTFPITVFRIPTLNTNGSCRLALALDAAAPQTLRGADATDDSAWSTNVIEHIEKLSGSIHVTAPGSHTLRIWKVDPSIAIDRIVIDTGGLRPSYLGPPESYRH